ncbi:hypothetical protein [Microterricola pindariensis]|uniref:Cardiolipin synthase N-terminal domain-containing protein n=1 Tax=Microterricola pindariensis TaxID=478010 RepID=A0ABX5AV95_9MICO|nr:hypothetical protein [Microterricola pindariensis]PPL18817.1 hypothetical protein GY24_09055 [Microterricola pindariensis]
MDLSIEGLGGGGIWFTLSLINAGLAESKGRGRFNWWLLSLLLGPIATLLIVVMPRGPFVDELPGAQAEAGQLSTQS